MEKPPRTDPAIGAAMIATSRRLAETLLKGASEEDARLLGKVLLVLREADRLWTQSPTRQNLVRINETVTKIHTTLDDIANRGS